MRAGAGNPGVGGAGPFGPRFRRRLARGCGADTVTRRRKVRTGVKHWMRFCSRQAHTCVRFRHALPAFFFLLLGGCGPSRSHDGRVHLVVTLPADQLTKPIYENLIADFEKRHPTIEVEQIAIPRDYYGKVLVMIAGRDAPDLMWMGQGFAEFATRGVFLDISDRLAAEVDTTEFLPQALSWYRIDGKQYGVPFGVDMEFIVYNKALFDKAALPYPSDDWDVWDLLDKAKRLTIDLDGDGRTDQYGFRGRIDPSAFGAAILAPDGSRALCNSPEMIECLKFNLDLVFKWKVAPLPDEMDQEGLDEYTVFRQGRAAMMKMHTWNLPFLRKRCADVDWDIVCSPRARQRGRWASSQAVLIAADTRHPDEAWLLCREFFSDKFLEAMASRGLPPNLRVARRCIAKNRQRPANLAALLKGADSLHPFPRVPHLNELLAHYWEAVSAVYARRTTPEEAMARAEKEIRRAVTRQRRRKTR